MKKHRTRKEKVLRQIAALFVIAALLTVTDAVNFLPWQAVEDMAETQNISEIECICSFYNDKLKCYRFARQYLVEGEEALMLCTVGYEPIMGWYDRVWCVAPTRGDVPLCVGYRGHSQGEDYVGYAFGRVDDARVARIEYRCQISTEETYKTWEVPQEAFFREDGKKYFLWETDAFDENTEAGRYLHSMTAIAYDESDAILYEKEVLWHSWGSST